MIGAFRLQSRTHLEQRFLDTGSDTGWRFRQFVKLSRYLPNRTRMSLEIYDEMFLDLNGTDWGQRSGFSQNRLFIGLGVRLDERRRSRIEVGYLNQFLNRSRQDRINQILSVNLFASF